MNDQKSKLDKVFWGICFLIGAAALVFSKLNLLPHLSFFNILCTIVLAMILVKSVIHRNFFGILIPLALLACIYDQPLGITALTPWTILGAALLASIGLSILFKRKPPFFNHHYSDFGNDSSVINEEDESNIHFQNSFGSSIKYINSENFVSGRFETSFGELQIYFDNAVIQDDNAQVTIDVSFGSMVLYVPRTWKVVSHVCATFGAIDGKNRSQETEGSPVLHIYGDVSFGEAQIIYI